MNILAILTRLLISLGTWNSMRNEPKVLRKGSFKVLSIREKSCCFTPCEQHKYEPSALYSYSSNLLQRFYCPQELSAPLSWSYCDKCVQLERARS